MNSPPQPTPNDPLSPRSPFGDAHATSPSVLGWPRLWFGFSRDVGQAVYAASGVGLMVFKYACEALLIYWLAQRWFTPLDFLNPLLSMRQQFFKPPAPDWLAWFVFFWTLPFLWISITMSVRRATNAGQSAWLGLLVLLPFVNYLGMLLLCLLPEKRAEAWWDVAERPEQRHRLKSAMLGILVSLLIGLVMVGIGVYALADYGVTLFLGTPIWMGAVSAFLFNRPTPRSFLGSLAVAEISILIAGGALLLFAFEGAICLVMLFPVAGMMGLLGGAIGYFFGVMTPTRAKHMTLGTLLLPLLAGAESRYRPTPEYEVVTSIEIDAPPEAVWPHVIGFSDLPDPPTWYFRLGIAYPKRATIKGSGVGAVRHCEFSTGPFVEPITAWERPRRLAFNVASQPVPMHELSPYRHVHPPHLDGYLRCKRGEFRLVPLPNGRTRLEGSTWYEFEIYPQAYWTLWSDAVIHRIHQRVLAHIKRLTEAR